MVRLATLTGTLTITADSTPRLPISLEVTDDDAFYVTLDVSRGAEIAASQRFRRFGERLDINGVSLPDREIGKVLTIAESVDAYGDTLTFQLVGPRFSPVARAMLRTRALVEVYFTYGSPGSEFTGKVFTGRVVSTQFSIQAPSATVTALDAAGFYALRKAESYALGPNHGKSRLQITLELLAIGGIPFRFIDLGGDGGTGKKPLTLGDRPILEFLREYLAVVGAEIGFENGGFVARRYDANAPYVVDLNPGNLLVPLSLVAPDTLKANVTGVVSTSFVRTEPTGIRGPVITSVVTVGPYAPIQYETLQNGETTSSNPAGTPTPTSRIISEVITATNFYGSLDIRTEETEAIWYAPRAAVAQITPSEDPPGYDVANLSTRQVYIYPDGSTRAIPKEEFQITSRKVTTKDLDAQRNVIHKREERYGFKQRRKALWLTDVDGVDVLQTGGPAIPLDDEGNGVIDITETMRLIEAADTDWTLNADGTISQEKKFEAFYSIGTERRHAYQARGWGVEDRTYTSSPEEKMAASEASISTADPGGWRLTITRYRAIDEDRYEITETVRDSSGAKPTVKTTRLTGALPRPERAEADQSSQEIRATVRDELRISLVGEEIEEVEHNEFVESIEEARAYATYKARLAGAIVLNCETPIEALIHKWRMVRLNIPGASIDGLKFYVRQVTRDAATYREAIVADYYPPSLG